VDASDPFGVVSCKKIEKPSDLSASSWNAFNLAVRLILSDA